MARRRSRSRQRGFARPGFSLSGVPALIMPAAVGAAGALAVNGITNYLIPESMRATLLTGNTAYVTRAGIALLIGIVGPRIPGVGRYARDMAMGALIVQAADFGKQIALSNDINLSGLSYIGPARIAASGQGNVRQLAQYIGRPGAMPRMAGMAGMGRLIRR